MEDVTRGVAAEVAPEVVVLAAMAERLDRLEAENREMRALISGASTGGPSDPVIEPVIEPNAIDEPIDRRRLVRNAIIAAGAAASGAVLLNPQQAAALQAFNDNVSITVNNVSSGLTVTNNGGQGAAIAAPGNVGLSVSGGGPHSGGIHHALLVSGLNNVHAVDAQSGGIAVYGRGTSSSAIGIQGESSNGYAVYGISQSSYGVAGRGENNYGVVGVSATTTGVYGHCEANAGGGVLGDSVSGSGVKGISSIGAGVEGVTDGGGTGVRGSSAAGGSGVRGINTGAGNGVTGDASGAGAGVQGTSTNGNGVSGTSTNKVGVYGTSTNDYGVYGKTQSTYGVAGRSESNYGVVGVSASSAGVYGTTESASGNGVQGQATGGSGVSGLGTTGSGVYGAAQTGVGVHARSTSGTGLDARSNSGRAAAFSSPFAQLHLDLATGGRGAPTNDTVAHAVGEIARDGSGNFWACVAAGTPGTWRKLAGPSTAGAFHVLAAPARIYDSRVGGAQGPKAPLTGGTPRVLDLKGASSGVPAGATAAMVTILLVNAATGDGNATIWANGVAKPTANTMVWGGSAKRYSTLAVTALDAAAKCQVAASTTTDVVLDVIGYYR